MRQAERAIFDLRRGLPVLVRNNGSDTLVQAVEGLDDIALAALQSLSGSPACLVLSSHRMAALGFSEVKTPVTLCLAPLPDSVRLREFAAQRGVQLPPGTPQATADKAGQATIRLLSRAQLLPAAVSCVVTPAQSAAVAAARRP